MSGVIKTEEKEEELNKLKCWKCSISSTEDDALDSVFRLSCNRCFHYRERQLKDVWVDQKKIVFHKCTFCLDAYKFKKKLRAHKCVMDGIFQCDLCVYQFESLKSLEVHLKVVHVLERKAIIDLTKHRTSVSNSKLCGKVFIQKVQRETHLRTHSEFNCNICGRTFSVKRTLENHMNTHIGEKPFDCKLCGKAFPKKYCLEIHMRLHMKEKPFNCTFCNKMFAQTGNLKSHMRTHTGEKPFSCKLCGKAFSFIQSLKNHIKIHTGEKPFNCIICGKTFSQAGHLKKHMLTHSREKKSLN